MPDLDLTGFQHLQEENAQLKARLAEMEIKEGRGLAAQAALQKELERYRFLCNKMLMGYAYFELIFEGEQAVDLQFFEVNPAFEHITGLEQAAGRRLSELRPGFDRNNARYSAALYQRVAQSGQPEQVEIFIESIRKWYAISLVSPQKGQIISLFDDITARKQAEASLMQDEARLRQVVETGRLGIWEWDLASDEVSWNDELLRIYGISRQEFTGKGQDYIAMTRADYREAQVKNISLALRNGVTEAQVLAGKMPESDLKELCIVRPNGDECYTLGDAITIVDPQGKPLRMLGVSYDITTRKMAEIALRESEIKFRTLSEQSQLGICILDGEEIKFLNQAVSEINGYSMDEMAKWKATDLARLVHPDERALADEKYNRQMQGDTPGVTHFEHRILTRSGEIKWVDQYAKRILLEGRPANLITFIDITPRKKAEEVARLAEQQYLHIYEHAVEGIFQSRPDGSFLSVNPAMARMYGYDSPSEMITWVGYDIAHKVYANAKNRQKFIRLLEARDYVFDFESPNRLKDGTIIWTRTNARAVRGEDGHVLYYEGFVTDITEHKQAYEKLHEAEQFMRTTINALPAHICVLDENGVILSVNQAWHNFAANNPPAPPNDGVGMNYLAVCDAACGPCSSGAADFAAGLRRILLGETESFALEYPCHTPWGEQRWFFAQVNHFPDSGSLRLVVTHEDITRRKQVEIDLQESNEKFRLLLQLLPVGISVLDQYGQVIDQNPALEKILSISREGLQRGDYRQRQYIHPDGSPMAAQEFPSYLVLHGSQSVEGVQIGVVIESGATIWTELSAAACSLGDWKAALVTSDITRRKQAEIALRESEEKFRAIFNNEIYAITIADAQTQQILDVNEAFCRLYGYTRDEILGGMVANDFTAEPRATQESLSNIIQTGASFNPLRMQRKKDGTLFPAEIVGNSYLWKGKRVVYVLVHDISTRRQMEAELLALNTRLEQRVVERTLELDHANQALAEAQETERRALALELHDELGQVLNRVKLSLDMVPMLGAEDSQKQFEVARQLVRDLIHRVRRISLELRPTMLDDLGLLPALHWLFDTYREQTGCQVHFKSTQLNQRFTPRVEIIAYRIVQEALTNISRHAGVKTADVQVRVDDQALHLHISDHGEGFEVQAALDKRTSTGLSGMRERARQLGGRLAIKSSPGQGTTLTAFLPLKPRTGPLMAPPAAPPQTPRLRRPAAKRKGKR